MRKTKKIRDAEAEKRARLIDPGDDWNLFVNSIIVKCQHCEKTTIVPVHSLAEGVWASRHRSRLQVTLTLGPGKNPGKHPVPILFGFMSPVNFSRLNQRKR